jgi:fructose-specific phosphotransferase system component IIB
VSIFNELQKREEIVKMKVDMRGGSGVGNMMTDEEIEF